MPIEQDELHQLLAKAFPDASIECKDLADDNDHWQVNIHSSLFAGKTRIEQHKMVQQVVKEYDIHALAIKTSY